MREYWLQTRRLPDGRVVRRGFCYRPAPSDLAARLEARRAADPVVVPANEIVREIRDAERR